MKTEFRGSDIPLEFRAEGSLLVGCAAPVDRAVTVGGRDFREEIRSSGVTGLESFTVRDRHLQDGGGRPVAGAPASAKAEIRNGGIYLEATLPEQVQAAVEVRQLVKNGTYRGLSLEFVCGRDEFRGSTRIIHEMEVVGIAVVERPAYLATSVDVRSIFRSIFRHVESVPLWIF